MMSTAIFLTYAHRPHFDEKDYEGWLRTHDNPFFNGIAGIGRYENWKLVPPYPAELGFDYFDIIHLDGSRDLEAFWFDAELTAFRRNWVAIWGYGSTPPPLVNGQGYLMEGPGMPPLAATPAGTLAFATDPADFSGRAAAAQWTITDVMPKHYAFPAEHRPLPWRTPAPADLPLPCRHLALVTEPGEIPAPFRYQVFPIAP
jgi:hypothetical protein